MKRRKCSICHLPGHDRRRHQTNPDFINVGGKTVPMRKDTHGRAHKSPKEREPYDESKLKVAPKGSGKAAAERRFEAAKARLDRAEAAVRAALRADDAETEAGFNRRKALRQEAKEARRHLDEARRAVDETYAYSKEISEEHYRRLNSH